MGECKIIIFKHPSINYFEGTSFSKFNSGLYGILSRANLAIVFTFLFSHVDKIYKFLGSWQKYVFR